MGLFYSVKGPDKYGDTDLEFHYGPITVAAILVLFVLPFLLSSIVVMGTGEVGVVTSFGKVTGKELSEGISLKLPAPFEEIHKFDIRVQKEEADASAATSDLQDANAKLVINYHLDRNSVSKLYQTVGSDYKQRLVDPAIQEIFKATTAKYSASELITKRSEVKEVARKTLEDRLHTRGIVVDDISIVNFEFSRDFSKAIESAQVAKQQVIQAQQELEKVKVEAEQKIATAQADAEAQRLKKESLTAELVQMEAIKKWDGKLPQYQLGGSTPFINIPSSATK